MVANSLGAVTSRLDLGDREHFRVPAASAADQLFISKPVIGRVSQKWSIQLARRIVDRDGSFAGVVVASLDPLYLSRLYNLLNIGTEGVATLIGADGIVRSRAPGTGRGIGESLAGTPLMRAIAQSPSGNYSVLSRIDGISRIFSYRAVDGYPLYVVVGIGEREALAGYIHDRSAYLTVASLVSLLLLVVIALLVRHQIGHDRTRAALDESNAGFVEKSQLLEVTLDNMTQGIMLIDADLRLQVVNRRAAELMNLPETLLATRPSLRDVLRIAWQRGDFGPVVEPFEPWFDGFLAAHAGPSHMREHHQADGTIVEVFSSNLPDGRVVRTFTDITERKHAEDALRAARDEATRLAQAKAEFLAMMSHEIRSPMSGLLGVVELLRDSGLDREQQEMAELVYGSGASLLRVLNDVLDFSKIDAGKVEPEFAPVDLRQFVSGLIASLAANATAKGLSLAADVDDELPAWISTDPMRLRQILTNLLGNAIKFTTEGSVSLGVSGASLPDGRGVAFAVGDTGIGIASDAIGRLFEPFTQADASTTRTFGGTGLGLTISRRLARLLGGDVEVTSEPGKGSVFTLCVPLVQAGDVAASAVEVVPGQQAALPAFRVLVAEDQLTNRWLVERQLRRLGCSVTSAEDGRAALAALDAAEYDMLITDCHMPEIDGVALTQMIRAGELAHGMRRMPILGLTADVTAAMHQRCLAAGMNEVAAKPIDLPHLRTAIARLVQRADPGGELAARPAETAVFDPANWRELFSDAEAEGRDWLADYLVTATELLAFVVQAAADGNRDPLRANVHKLASASLAVGAMRLGMLGRQLETAAPCEPDTELRRLVNALAAASHDAQAAIRQCLRTRETVA
jgi:signal transduction histidine kinase/CheY-like chemotaxis protein/HPt (histidine-containing phosphotransfer) domain-containing protein